MCVFDVCAVYGCVVCVVYMCCVWFVWCVWFVYGVMCMCVCICLVYCCIWVCCVWFVCVVCGLCVPLESREVKVNTDAKKPVTRPPFSSLSSSPHK